MLKKRRGFIVDEKDVTMVLGIINNHAKCPTIRTGHCGWAGKNSTKWFIFYDATKKTNVAIINELNNFFVFGTKSGTKDVVLTRKPI